jgi:uncharacterized protein
LGIVFSSVVPAPQNEAFDWHGRPGALERLTPPFQPVRVVSEAESLSGGQAVLRLPGGLRWVAAHEGERYDAPRCFTDRLVSLPLRWYHTHSFQQQTESSTLVTDTVETPVPERVLRPMFVYRHRQLAEDLACQHVLRPLRPTSLSVGVTGASGLVGRSLCPLLTTAGHRVVRLVRRVPARPDERFWDPEDPDPSIFEGLDAVVHLAGASIAGKFNETHKRAVRESRIGPTAKLAQALVRATDRPAVLVSASAVGYYGSRRGDEELREQSGPGDGFLAQVVQGWEQALSAAEDEGVRVVKVRTGIVQSPRGGALRLQWPLFEVGIGGRLGTGDQWLPWIDVDDLSDIYHRCIVDNRCLGPINGVAPNPVTNREYANTLARVLRRPAVLPVPTIGLNLALGPEGAREMAMASQRAVPDVLTGLGHGFRRPALEACLRHQLGRFAS